MAGWERVQRIGWNGLVRSREVVRSGIHSRVAWYGVDRLESSGVE